MGGDRELHTSGESLGRRVRLNTVVIPQVRILGFVAVLVLCGLNHALISASVSDQALVVFILGTAAYNAGSWLILSFFYTRLRRFDLGQFFLYTDVLFFTLAVYVTGAEKSWMLLILVLRSADQAGNGFATVLRFAHCTTAAYVGLLLWVQYAEQRPVNWSLELVKVAGLYFSNLYVSLTALVLDKVRRQMRNARDLISQLQKPAKDLEQEKQKARELAIQRDLLAVSVSERLRRPLEQIAEQAQAPGMEEVAHLAARALADLNEMVQPSSQAKPGARRS